MNVVVDNGTVLVLISLLAIPFAALTFSRAGEVYRSINKGALTLGQELPLPRYLRRPAQAVDPAIQAAEVRQMLAAKSEHRQRHGESPIDVDAETTRLLAAPDEAPSADARQSAELRAGVRQLVVSRNERRMRQGLQPLNVKAETDRQLSDFVGSG
jgi:hypothetical protein